MFQFLFGQNNIVKSLLSDMVGPLTLLSFVFQCKKLDPSALKLCIEGMQPQLSKLFDSCASNLRGASAELNSSDPRSEA